MRSGFLWGKGAMQEEVRNAACTLIQAVRARREGRMIAAGEGLKAPREK